VARYGHLYTPSADDHEATWTGTLPFLFGLPVLADPER
jgi:hypothetical protein